MRKLIISLAAAAAVTAAAPALAQPPAHTQAHVAAIVWHPGGCPNCHNLG